MELNRDGGPTNDVITVFGALTYGGTLKLQVTGAAALQVDDTFTLFSFLGAPAGAFAQVQVPAGYTFDTTQLNVAGTVKVTGVPPTLPTVPTILTHREQRQITLMASYKGWYLQAQTNPITVGLSTNWVTLTNSSTTNLVVFPWSRKGDGVLPDVAQP
jgi:hypothetical protein